MTQNEPTGSQPLPPRVPEEEEEKKLRERARKRVERLRGVKKTIALFVVGMVVLTPVWLVVEWQSAGGFKRWSDGDKPGDWDPWILWIAVPWFLWVALVCLRAYFERDKEAEIEREIARLRSQR